MGKISIYVMAHKAFEEPNDSVYIPMQVGAAINDDLGYKRDDEGENISAKNKNFCELTGLYWIWKNDRESDYVGLCHYRRYFLGADGNKLPGAEYERFFKECKAAKINAVITSPRACSDVSVQDFYINSGHHIEDLKCAREAISKLSPPYLKYFDEVMNGNATYFANMIVGKRETIGSYCDWLFKILFYMEEHLDISNYDDYNKRVFGFVSERLLMVWLLKNKIAVQECMVDMVDDRK